MAPPGFTSKKTTTSKSSSTSGGPPGFTSKKTTSKSSSTSGGPPGTSSGKSSQDILKDLKKEISRREYFKGREDVSDDRLLRRYEQAEQQRKYKQDLVRQGKYVTDSQGKPVRTASGDYVYTGTATFDTDTSSPTFGRYVTYGVTDKAKELANKYGPTFSEIGSDMGYAFGSMARGAGDILKSGSFGILGAIKGIANYALDKANKGYDKLNDVQKYVFDNADRFTFASKVPQVDEVSKAEELALQADRDALGLELDTLIAQREADRFRYENPTVDLRSAKDYIDYSRSFPSYETTAPIDVKQKFQSAAENYLDPEAREAAIEELRKEKQIQSNQEKSELSILEALNPFDNIPTGIALNELINPDQQDISQFKKEMDQGFIDDQASLSTDDGTKITAFNNPGNLQFAGQQGAIEGQTYGNNFAVFPNAEVGISALRNDLTAKVNRSNKVDDIIGEYAPKADNPESFNNYVSFVKDRVGETVEPNEIDDLTRSVIQFENKPDIANQYLNLLDQPTLVADASKRDIKTLQPIRDMGIGYDMGVDMFSPVIRDLKEKNPTLTDEEIRGIIEGTITQPTGVFAADGGMIDKKLKSLQNGLQNMYNGIPSVKRR